MPGAWHARSAGYQKLERVFHWANIHLISCGMGDSELPFLRMRTCITCCKEGQNEQSFSDWADETISPCQIITALWQLLFSDRNDIINIQETLIPSSCLHSDRPYDSIHLWRVNFKIANNSVLNESDKLRPSGNGGTADERLFGAKALQAPSIIRRSS